MKRFALLAIVSLPLLTGCNGCANDIKHFQSKTIGMNRTVTLYSADGTKIKEWKTSSVVEDQGGTLYFIDKGGRSVYIGGTLTVEED